MTPRLCARVWARGFGLGSALFLGCAPVAHACQSCFGAEDSPLIDGAKLGAVALVLVTASVQGAFVAFFLHLKKRAKHASNREPAAPSSRSPRGRA